MVCQLLLGAVQAGCPGLSFPNQDPGVKLALCHQYSVTASLSSLSFQIAFKDPTETDVQHL